MTFYDLISYDILSTIMWNLVFFSLIYALIMPLTHR